MKGLLRLYPRSWRRRYGREMEVLIEELPAGPAVALDLLVGAAGAYAAVVRGNRILSAAGAFLHGLCVAVLIQAIAFVTTVLFTQGSPDISEVWLGPFNVATVYQRSWLHGPFLQDLNQGILVVVNWLPGALLLMVLLVALAFVVAAPRLLRTVR